jgi:hypothetical protein
MQDPNRDLNHCSCLQELFWTAVDTTAFISRNWVDMNDDYKFSITKESKRINETD